MVLSPKLFGTRGPASGYWAAAVNRRQASSHDQPVTDITRSRIRTLPFFEAFPSDLANFAVTSAHRGYFAGIFVTHAAILTLSGHLPKFLSSVTQSAFAGREPPRQKECHGSQSRSVVYGKRPR